MRPTTPSVYLIARPSLDWDEIRRYLRDVGGMEWADRIAAEEGAEGERLVEFAGRLCYRSWAAGLNPNVGRVRTDSAAYLQNILSSAHGSVLEHANYSFVFKDVSRVFTHELVRHRAGTAISQESLRYVRLSEIPFQHPEYVASNPMLLEKANELLQRMEEFQTISAEVTGVDRPEVNFAVKKEITSAARRYAPDGVSTSIAWTANIRALRHIVALRTAPAAESEMRLVFGLVAEILKRELPILFGDFERQEDDSWTARYPKV